MNIALHAFPSTDLAFVAFAQAALAVLPEPPTPAALQRALRVRYPTAVVTQQAEFARHGDGPIVWYAFRTAASDPAGPEVAPEKAGAWAILGDDRRFIQVSTALARIAELPGRRMVGHRVEDFSNPSDPTIRDDITRLWGEFRSNGSLASTLRFNFRDGRPRELAYRLVADADGPGRHRLTVSVLPEPDEEREPPQATVPGDA